MKCMTGRFLRSIVLLFSFFSSISVFIFIIKMVSFRIVYLSEERFVKQFFWWLAKSQNHQHPTELIAFHLSKADANQKREKPATFNEYYSLWFQYQNHSLTGSIHTANLFYRTLTLARIFRSLQMDSIHWNTCDLLCNAMHFLGNVFLECKQQN